MSEASKPFPAGEPGAELPIDRVLDALVSALAASPNVVLHAPPGAGKTTRAPLALLDAPWLGGGRIIMLEPRRIAARAAAERLASAFGESPGGRVGYRIRDETRIGRATRIEVVTEGVLTRMLQSDPGLEGVGCVIFDEFHERSIHADLGLALCLEAQAALQPELRLLVMSATLAVERVAALMGGAPIVASEGRAYPVETRYLDAPLKPERAGGPRRADATADLARTALEAAPEGDVLVFLPGQGEIRRAAARLADAVGEGVDIRPIYGDLPIERQRAAIAPSPAGRRKIVLATAIAETSLTIEGVRVVVDSGLARRALFDPARGMSRLVTTRASRAAAEQRRGRAGRLGPGVCYRLWTRGEEGAMPEFDAPEIAEADLAPLALDLAAWGARPEALSFLDPPPEAAFARAEELLKALGALEPSGAISAHGRVLAEAPVHPRLGHMLIRSGVSPRAAMLAALLEERDPLASLAQADLTRRLDAIARPASQGEARGALERIAARARRLRQRLAGHEDKSLWTLSDGALAALAFPDRVAQRRPGDAARFRLSGGAGARLDDSDPLASAALLAIADATGATAAGLGSGAEARIRLAAPVSEAELVALMPEGFREEDVCVWDARAGRVVARRRRMFGALVLNEEPWRDAPPEALRAAMLDGVRQLGLQALPFTPAAERLRARAGKARAAAPDAGVPDLSDAALLESLEHWLEPHLDGVTRREDLAKLDIAALLDASLDWPARQALDRAAPRTFLAPSGRTHPIDYSGGPPKVSLRLQELYGLAEHPRIAGEPVLFELLSPAQRPIQTTADLPGFWTGSYRDVAKDMRARYPKHDWPEDPAAARPSAGAPRRRGSS